MNTLKLAALCGCLGLSAASSEAFGDVTGLTPAGYIGEGGVADSIALITGTHFYTFWTAGTAGPLNAIEDQVFRRTHNDSDFGGQGFQFVTTLQGDVLDVDPLRVGDGAIHSVSVWLTLPEDYQTYTPDQWGPGNGGTTRYTYFGNFLVHQAFSEADAGLPYWFTVDDPDALRAVPEPGTWAMMILGFGLVGMGLRRRQMLSA